MIGKINIVLVDDHAILIDGIQALLSGIPDMHVVGKASNGVEALAILSKEKVDLVITDYSMEGMDGLSLAQRIKTDHPGTKIIMLSMHDDPSIVQEVFRTGIDGYIFKKNTHQELLGAVNQVLQGAQFRSPEISKILFKKLQPESSGALTDREMDVLKLLVNELNTREIAKKLDISERTVETHRKNLLRKTNSVNIVGLVKYAHAKGVL